MLEGNSGRDERPEPAGNAGLGYGAYLNLADHLTQSGRKSEAMMLYLTAYEGAAGSQEGKLPNDHPAVEGLHRAWDMACELEDHDMAEAIHSRLAPYLTPAEAHAFATRMQQFALGRLKQVGLQAQSLSRPEGGSAPTTDSLLNRLAQLGRVADFSDSPLLPDVSDDEEAEQEERLTYDSLVGFETAVMQMRQRGVGLSRDEGFSSFVARLNERHGIDGLPSFETLLFRAPGREDATRFMFATAGELNMPIIRIRMETNAQGLSVLCIMTSPQVRNKFGFLFSETGERGVLMLEDVDLWGLPLAGFEDDEAGSGQAHLSRGAQKAMALIRAAVDNPNVVVMASASSDVFLKDGMIDLLAPLTPIDLEQPTYAERARLWTSLVQQHQSLARLDVVKLVQLSANLSRFEITACAREAVEQAYLDSILKREYVRVSEANLYEKLCNCQPLDSREYHMLEDAIVSDFAHDLDALDTYWGEGDR